MNKRVGLIFFGVLVLIVSLNFLSVHYFDSSLFTGKASSIVQISILGTSTSSSSGGVPSGTSGGGGGGGTGTICYEDWNCEGWEVCQSARESLDEGIISPEDYEKIKDVCEQNEFAGNFCGFQISRCVDANSCDRDVPKVPRPGDVQVCYFTEDPSCSDGITNCHSGGCEALVDCGGPCAPCTTCSDGMRNQGEEGIDCGGPCPNSCELEFPLFISFNNLILVILLILIIVFLIILLILYKRRKKKDKKKKLKRK